MHKRRDGRPVAKNESSHLGKETMLTLKFIVNRSRHLSVDNRFSRSGNVFAKLGIDERPSDDGAVSREERSLQKHFIQDRIASSMINSPA